MEEPRNTIVDSGLASTLEAAQLASSNAIDAYLAKHPKVDRNLLFSEERPSESIGGGFQWKVMKSII